MVVDGKKVTNLECPELEDLTTIDDVALEVYDRWGNMCDGNALDGHAVVCSGTAVCPGRTLPSATTDAKGVFSFRSSVKIRSAIFREQSGDGQKFPYKFPAIRSRSSDGACLRAIEDPDTREFMRVGQCVSYGVTGARGMYGTVGAVTGKTTFTTWMYRPYDELKDRVETPPEAWLIDQQFILSNHVRAACCLSEHLI